MEEECRKEEESRVVALVFREPLPWGAVSALTYTPRSTMRSLGDKSLLVFFKSEAGNKEPGATAWNLPLEDLARNPWLGFKPEDPDIEDLCFRLGFDYALRLAEDTAWDEREKMKGKKARWGKGKNTKMPLYDKVYERSQTSFKERYEALLKVMDAVDITVERDPRGRKPTFSPKKVLSAAVAGAGNSLRKNAQAVRDADLDLTVSGDPSRKPCYNTINYHLKKVGRETLDEIVSLLYMVGETIYTGITGEKPTSFTVDGSARTSAHTERRMVAGRETLTHSHLPHQFASNNETNLIRGADALSGQNDATRLLEGIPEGSTVCLDRAYYTERNIRASEGRGHRYNIRAKRYRGRDYKGASFRRCRERFNPDEYRLRKLGERPFANTEARSGKTVHHGSGEAHDRRIKLEAARHNIQRTAFYLEARRLFIPLGKPPPEETTLPDYIEQVLSTPA